MWLSTVDVSIDKCVIQSSLLSVFQSILLGLFKFSFLNNNGARHSRGVTSNISVEVSGGSAAAPVVVEVDVRVLQ